MSAPPQPAHMTRFGVVRSIMWAAIVLWTACIVSSYAWSLFRERKSMYWALRQSAAAQIQKDVIYRSWNAQMGGVYVPVTAETQPNPYLTDIEDRDLTTVDGRQLTLMNPAYMTRKVHELGLASAGVRARLTSLDPIRPANAPDAWQKEALEAFETGALEYSTVETLENGQAYLRFMQPMVTEQSCLKCHANQGYEVGDIRGGICVSLPIAPYLAAHRKEAQQIAAAHGLLWLLGMGIVAYGGRWMTLANRQNQLAMNHYNELFRKLGQQVPGMIYQYQMDPATGRHWCPYCSEGIRELVGLDPESLHQDATPFFELIHPEDLEKMRTSVERSAAALQVWQCEFRIRTSVHDTPQWIEGHAAPESLSDGTLLWHGFITNITERRQSQEKIRISEQRFEEVARHSQSYVWEIDTQGLFTYISESVEPLLGYAARELVGQVHYYDLHPVEGREDFRQSTMAEMACGKQLLDIENQIQCRDGQTIWVSTNALPMFDQAGQLTGYRGSDKNITAMKQAEQELRAGNRRLAEATRRAEAMAAAAQRANEAKSSFLATMSHEIRTPMNSVIGMTSLLLHTELTPEQNEYAETIRNSGDALLSLINDILDFSKIEAGEVSLELAAFELSDCIADPLEIMAAQARQKSVELAYEIDGAAPASLIGDNGRIRQILLNLISNAIKFSHDAGRVEVRTTCARLEDGRWQLQVSVRDDGIGISCEAQANLFKPFVQADNTITRRYGGTGLGLAISQRLAQLMGGSLSCESSAGQGSTFTLHVPLEPSTIKSRVFERKDNHRLENKKLLVVDAVALNRRMFRTQAEAWGMIVREAPSRQDALTAGAEFCPHLILTDVQLPDGSGLDLAREVRQSEWGGIPILLNTSELLQRSELPPELCDDLLLKPVRQAALFNSLVKLLNAHTGDDAGITTAVRVSDQIDSQLAQQYPLTILVVEDNAMNVRVLCHILNKFGYLADTAGHGLEAVECCQRQPYDLVLMDLEMPVMGGLEATVKIRESLPAERQPMIVALTAHALGEQAQACIDCGMDAFMTKPIKIPRLVRLLKESYLKRNG